MKKDFFQSEKLPDPIMLPEAITGRLSLEKQREYLEIIKRQNEDSNTMLYANDQAKFFEQEQNDVNRKAELEREAGISG
ncbi:MAG: hypothetical protein AAB631_02805 [Patescibacteria group bacterium]